MCCIKTLHYQTQRIPFKARIHIFIWIKLQLGVKVLHKKFWNMLLNMCYVTSFSLSRPVTQIHA